MATSINSGGGLTVAPVYNEGSTVPTLFVLMDVDHDYCDAVAVYSDEATAKKAAEEREAEWQRLNPAHDEWCRRRWKYVEEWRASGRIPNRVLGLPDDEGEAEIKRLIGDPPPAPPGTGRCSVHRAENRLANK